MASPYDRPRLVWIKRRARRLMKFYRVSRRLAISDAAEDYGHFIGSRRPSLTLIAGGKS